MLRILILIVCLVNPFLGISQNKKSEKPNIIFIFTDDLGYGDIGVFFQNERKKHNDRSKPWTSTPNLDIMANEGAILTQHYAAAPVCAPSRASLLSGLSQGHANVRNNQFDKALADNHTMANVLKRAGYVTSAIGKWGLQGDKRWSRNNGEWVGKPTNRGFDYFYGYMRHVDGHEHYPNEGIYRGVKSVWENNREISSGLDKCFTGDLWTAAAKKWITDQAQNQRKPFFMFLAYDTPHAVLELPTQEYPKGGGLHGGVQWVGQKGQMINTASGVPDSYIHPDYDNATYDHDSDQATPEIPWPDTYKRYATGVRRIDDAVGDIFQLLKDLKIDENTLVVFSSDNGPSKESYLPERYVENTPDFFDSFGPFDGIKRDVLEGGVRVPTLARWPNRIPRRTVVKTPNISYDWLPTFVAATGWPAPANSDGVSLLPSLTGNGKQKEGLVYVEYFQNGKTPDYQEFSIHNRNRGRNEMQMIHMDNLIGLRYDIKSAADDFEIYDVKNDTHQDNNLASHDSMQRIQQKMKNRVLQVRRPDTSAIRPYDEVNIPSIALEKLSKGLRWKGFQGQFPWLPKMEDLNAVENGIIKNSISTGLKRIDQNLVLFEGYIKAPKTGTYSLIFKSMGKALIRIHESTIFDADYNHQEETEMTEKIRLEAGFHPVRIYVHNEKQADTFDFSWKFEGVTETTPIEFYQ